MKRQAPRAAHAGERRRAGERDAAEAGFRARVLVVDDDRVDRMAVNRLLSGVAGDVELDEADGVLAAIERLAAEPFDCVVLDYNLPDGDGLTFLRGMRTAGLEVPVVMLTGQDDAAVARELILAGAAAYVSKANLSAHLLTSIQNAIRARP
ncbi:MAG TPA: response regulator transcription factor [Longimicrobium sp.]|nr:response regulator transcription factor [Longimicrobium sp.]